VPPRAIVIGGSLGGLNAALQLRRAGGEVEVFERRTRTQSDRAAGVLLQPSTARLLAGCGVPETAFTDAECESLRQYDSAGVLRNETRERYRFVSWVSLRHAMLAALGDEHFHPGRSLVGLEQSGDSATARLSGGQVEHADLVVCADGTSSASRRVLLPNSFPRYAGYVAWRGRASETDLPSAVFSRFANAVSALWLPHGHVLVHPSPVPADERRQLDFVWYRNVPDGPGLTAVLTDRTGRRRSLSVPAGLVADGLVEEMLLAATEVMPAEFAAVVTAESEPRVEQIVDVTVPRMAFGRVCLIGDAAFTMRPHVGAGAAKAFEDGWALARALSTAGGDVVAALAEWEPARLDRGHRLVASVRAEARRGHNGEAWFGDLGFEFGPH
jgi:2,6-dihydroxypyridine 3-monooxygenase